MRISHIKILGADQSFAEIASATMQGNYFGIIPCDSIFFFPASRIRADIIAAHPDIAAVSISRDGFTSISITINDRVPIARWCPSTDSAYSMSSGQASSSQASSGQTDCYVFDAGGFIFALAASSTKTINNFALYAPLVGETPEPLRATVAHAETLPGMFDFARELATFGSSVASVVIRGDEVDEYLESSTRITYVLGHEQDAFSALVSARANMNLADGSLDYVDLRFDGKVYLKRKK